MGLLVFKSRRPHHEFMSRFRNVSRSPRDTPIVPSPTSTRCCDGFGCPRWTTRAALRRRCLGVLDLEPDPTEVLFKTLDVVAEMMDQLGGVVLIAGGR